MVNPAVQGRQYPPTPPYEVGREKIREFAEATGPQPANLDPLAARALGHPDVIAPPTFAVIVAQRCDAQLVLDPDSGIDYSRVVHGEQRFVHHRPIVAGDELQVTLTVENIRVAAGNELITNKSEVKTVDGELVTTAYGVIVVRGGAK